MKASVYYLMAPLGFSALACGTAFQNPEPLVPPVPPSDTVCLEPDEVNSPWLVGLDGTARGSISRSIEKGLMLVKQGECGTFKMLPNCYIPGSSYKEWMSGQLRVDSVDITSRTTLQRKVPMAVAKYSRAMNTGDDWSLDYVEAGEKSYEGNLDDIDWTKIRGSCREATHYVYALTLGAFQLSIAKSAESQANGYVGPADWENRAKRNKIEKSEDGNYADCAATGDPSSISCKGLIKIWVEPIPENLLAKPIRVFGPPISDGEPKEETVEERPAVSEPSPPERTLRDAAVEAEAKEKAAREAAARKAEASRQGSAGAQWVQIEGGRFKMGGDGGENDEKPPHWVSVPAFEMLKTEVTVDQYKACSGCSKPGDKDESKYCNWGYSDRGKHPINCVDWTQADAYCRSVGGRLPSEAEWEYAARSGGKDRKYPWGDQSVTCDYAIWGDGGSKDGCGKDSTWPVCSKTRGKTEQGLCDMAGNVWEWTEDWYHNSYNGAPTAGSAWVSGGGESRVLRGGSWRSVDGDSLRASYRAGFTPTYWYSLYGFRCVRSSQ